jgi:hypothetical protein
MNEGDAGKRGRIAVVLAALLSAAVVIAGCSMIGVHTYEEFRSAVDSGATCSQLWDIEQNFEGTADEERVVSDLKEMGCDTARSARNDRQNG